MSSLLTTARGTARRGVILSGFTRTVAPASAPLTASDAKAFLRISSSDDDAQIVAYISAAVALVERHCRTSLISQTWRATFDRVCQGDSIESNWFELPHGPVQSITSVKTVDDDGAETTLDVADYSLDADYQPGRLIFPDGLPEMSTVQLPSLRIVYVAGYADADAVPADIVHALRFLVSHFYELRLPVTEKPMTEMPFAVRSLLAPYCNLIVA